MKNNNYCAFAFGIKYILSTRTVSQSTASRDGLVGQNTNVVKEELPP